MAKEKKEETKSIVEMVEAVQEMISAAVEDAKKFEEKGNSAAGTRVRKAMQALKKQAQTIRIAVGEAKSA